MDFGEIVLALREVNNLSRKQLADYLSRSVSFVKKIEVERKSAPPKAVVKKIATLFELDFDGLWRIAQRERMIRWFRKEGINPYLVVVLSRTLDDNQRRWIKECPNILKQSPYRRFVLYDGMETIRRLQEDYKGRSFTDSSEPQL